MLSKFYALAFVPCLILLATMTREAMADGNIFQVCKASTIQENGRYRENADGTWTVDCCGTAQRVDGGSVAFLPEHGDCEQATAATRATALSTCRANWAAKRCP